MIIVQMVGYMSDAIEVATCPYSEIKSNAA